jgi:hypothetical protein
VVSLGGASCALNAPEINANPTVNEYWRRSMRRLTEGGLLKCS